MSQLCNRVSLACIPRKVAVDGGIGMADCWHCRYRNTQYCEGCLEGYYDGVDGWIQFEVPTHYEPDPEKIESESIKNSK